MTQFMKLLSLTAILLFGYAAVTDANAQNLSRGKGIGQSGGGTDVWTTTMAGLGLFRAHRDNCNATTEVFVKVYTNASSVEFGYCIDKDEHSAGAVQWEDARKECLDDGKRLPEPGEWKYSCDSVTGLNNMTDDWEWSSNFHSNIWKPTGDIRNGATGLIAGSGNCKKSAHGWVGSTATYSDTFTFRCVR